MHKFLLGATCAVMTVFALPVAAHDYTLGDLRIGHPWTRATAAAGAAGAGYLTIRNTGQQPDRLLRAESALAGTVELHTMTMDQGVMRMRPVSEIAIPPGHEVKLEPGGLHVMLLDTRRRFQQRERVPLTLVFERAGRIEVELAVEAPGARGAAHGHTH
jgi:copper(I)-binding protein